MRLFFKTLSTVFLLFLLSGTVYSSSDGWRYNKKDMSGTGYYPNTSSIRTDDNLVQKFYLSGSSGYVLTGDVTGNGYMEIIHVDKDQLNIYDYQGNLQRNVTLNSPNCTLTMIEDINEDNINDIGIGTSNTSNLATYFYDGNGHLLKTLSKSAGSDCSMSPVGLTSNGDFIISLGAGYRHSDKNRGFSVYDKITGSEKWNYKVGPCSGISSVADFDNDGALEITSSAYTCHNGCNANGFNGNGTMTTDGDMWIIVVDEEGNEEFSKIYPNPKNGGTSHYFIDLDHDGQMEILAVEGHDPNYYNGTSQIHLYDQYGTLTKTFDGASNENWSFAVADMTGDGIDEIITCNGRNSQTLYILDSSLSEINSTSVLGHIQLVSDINGDGKNEIVILSKAGIITVFDSELNILDTFDVQSNGKVIASDIDNDGVVELICRTNNIYVIENSSSSSQPVPSNNWLIKSFINTKYYGSSIELELKTLTSFVCQVEDSSGNFVKDLSYKYFFGDGSFIIDDSGFPVDYQYNTAGVYDAKCIVTDSSGNTVTSITIKVTVYEETVIIDTGFKPSIDGLPVENGKFYDNVINSSTDPLEEWDESGSCMAVSILTQTYFKLGKPSGGLYSYLNSNSLGASGIYLLLPSTFRDIFQTIGNLYAVIQQIFSKNNDLNDLISAVDEMGTGTPAIIAAKFDFSSSEKNKGHAVLGYKLTYIKAIGEYRLYVYDSNYPYNPKSPGNEDDCYFIVEQNGGNITYSKYKEFNSISGHVPSGTFSWLYQAAKAVLN